MKIMFEIKFDDFHYDFYSRLWVKIPTWYLKITVEIIILLVGLRSRWFLDALRTRGYTHTEGVIHESFDNKPFLAFDHIVK